MKKLLLVVLVFFMASNVSRAQWAAFETNFPWSLFDVSFVDPSTGLAVGEQGSVLRSIDGAATWEVVLSVPGKWFNSVHFATDGVDNVAYAVGTFGLLYKSVDGGVTWIDQSIAGFDKHFRGVNVRPTNLLDVIVVGYAGNMYKTLDGGTTWNQDTSIPWTMHAVDRSSLGPSFVVVIAATDGRIYRSIDNGSTWNFIDIRSSLNVWEYLNGVAFAGFGSVDAIIVGNSNRVLKSTDSGENWAIITDADFSDPMFSTNLRDVDWVGATVVAVGDGGKIFKSALDGANNTWTPEASGTDKHLYGVSLVNDGGTVVGFAVGEIGNGSSAASVMADNLQVSVNPISSVVPDKFVLEQNYPNPYNPSTTIRFSIPQASLVKLNVYDLTGRLIETLVNENLSAGTFAYTFDASKFTSGTYFYRLEAGSFVDTKKMILVK